jgi:Spy/CpxP family protein refolding chaperone
MVKSLLIGMLAASVVLGAALAPVEARPHGGMHGGMLPRLQAELGLSDDQVQAIRQVHADQRDARKQLRHSLRDAHRTLRQMVIDGVDDATVQQQTAAVQQLLGQAVQMRTETLRAVSQVLTPEQRQKFRELRSRWH